MEQLTTLLAPILVTVLTQGVKKIQSIPISSGQTAKIRVFVAIASFVVAVTQGYLNGTLDQTVPLIADTITNFAGATVAYMGWKSVKPSV